MQSPLTKGAHRYIMLKVFKDSGCESVNPAENAADTIRLRCFRVDTKAAFYFLKRERDNAAIQYSEVNSNNA